MTFREINTEDEKNEPFSNTSIDLYFLEEISQTIYYFVINKFIRFVRTQSLE